MQLEEHLITHAKLFLKPPCFFCCLFCLFFAYCAYFHLPYFTLENKKEKKQKSSACDSARQAKGITTNPLCSRRSLRVSQRQSLCVFQCVLKEFMILSLL